MRILSATLGNVRAPQQPHKVPFQQILPLRLKDRVSGKSDSQNEIGCLQEMSVLFTCLKDNDFQDSFCGAEVLSFSTCYKQYLDQHSTKSLNNHRSAKSGKDLSFKQLNKYLRGFPSN